MTTLQAWDIYDKGWHWFDTVYYVPSMSSDEVRQFLIDHNGYDEDIRVVHNEL